MADGALARHDRVVIRCLRRVHFDVDPGSAGRARVRCRDCRSESGEIVIHAFDLATGQLVGTERYRSVRELIEATEPTGASGAGAQRGV